MKNSLYIKYHNWKVQSMTQLKCSDYGFECDFITSAESGDIAVQFSEHSEQVHGIEYPIEVINQIIIRKS